MSFSDLLSFSSGRPSLTAPRKRSGIYGVIAVVFVTTFVAAVQQGFTKTGAEINWVDVGGEGATCVAGLAWLYFVIAWRPAGPVTQWLSAGFALLSYGFFLDLLDEFIRFSHTGWGQSMESIVTPVAIMVLTIAALLLHQEQRILRRQQQRREANFRNHQAIDPITDLYNADYCRQTLAAAIEADEPLALWLVDIENFDHINRQFDFAVGDAVLNRVAATLVASVPRDSLVCRYAGDRFIALTRQRELALCLSQTLRDLLNNAMTLALFDAAGREVPCGVRVASVTPGDGETADAVLLRANQLLQAQKYSGDQ